MGAFMLSFYQVSCSLHKSFLEPALVGQLPAPMALGHSLVIANRTDTASNGVRRRRPQPCREVPPVGGAAAMGMAVSARAERRPVPGPAARSGSQPPARRHAGIRGA